MRASRHAVQESSSYMPSVRPERRREAVNEMIASTRQALQILTQCLVSHQGGDRVHKQVREGASAWAG